MRNGSRALLEEIDDAGKVSLAALAALNSAGGGKRFSH
jgi:hypothetical protein